MLKSVEFLTWHTDFLNKFYNYICIVIYMYLNTSLPDMMMPKKTLSHVTQVDSKIQNTYGMEKLKNVQLYLRLLRRKCFNISSNNKFFNFCVYVPQAMINFLAKLTWEFTKLVYIRGLFSFQDHLKVSTLISHQQHTY